MKKRRHRYYQMAGPVKYQMTGARQDNTAVNRVLPLEMEMANTANSRDEFGRAYPAQQNPGTLSAPVSLDPNMGFVRHAGESPAMSRYKEDVFKREVQGGFAGAGLGAASHYAGRGLRGLRALRALRGANKMRPFGPPNIMQEFDVPRTPTPRPGPPNIMQETDKVFKSTPSGPPKIMQEADRVFTPKGRPGPANVTPEFDVPRVPRTKPGPANIVQESDPLGSMTSEQLEALKALGIHKGNLYKKFRYGGAAHRYMRY